MSDKKKRLAKLEKKVKPFDLAALLALAPPLDASRADEPGPAHPRL